MPEQTRLRRGRLEHEIGTVLVGHPTSEVYGSDRVMLETVRGLIESHWRVVVALPTDGPLRGAIARLGGETVLCPSPVLRRNALRPAGLAALVAETVRGWWRGRRLLRDVRPDVLYASTVTVPLWNLLARAARIPVLVHVHEGERVASRPLRLGLAAPLLLASRVVASSDFRLGVLTDDVPQLHLKSAVVYNGVSGPAFGVDPRQDVTGTLRLVYVGSLSPRKGVDVAVRALDELVRCGVDAELDLVGAAPSEDEQFGRELRQLARDLRVEDRVRFHGVQTDAWRFVQAADVQLVPSIADEPFSDTAVEATLAARPVVVSAVGGLPEAVDGMHSAISVTPGDAVALSDAVLVIRGHWAHMREAALGDAITAEERFSPAAYREGICAEIAAVVAAHHMRRVPAAHRFDERKAVLR